MTWNICSPMSLHNNIIAYLTRVSGENGTLWATCFMYDSIVGLKCIIIRLSPRVCRSTSKCWTRMITRRWPSFQFTIHPYRRIRPPAWASCRSAPLIATSRPSNSSSPSAAAIRRVIFSSTPAPVSLDCTARTASTAK